MNTVDKVLAIAKSQVGYLEKSAAAYKKDKNILYKMTDGAGSDNYTKYNYEMHQIYPEVMDFPASWCDAFVDWCFYQAYGIANAKALLGGNFDDYTPSSANLYKKKNAYYKTPKVGDQIFFNNGTRICHTGLVIDVDSSRVYTIEGNTGGGSTLIANGGGVAKKSYPLNYEKIDGYGRPKYDTSSTKDGWVQEGEDWFYYELGVKQKKKWIKSNHHWYRVGNDGAMLIGWHKIYDESGNLCSCYFDETKENLGAEWHERSDRIGYLEIWTVD